MKIETEVKLFLEDDVVDNIISTICKMYDCRKNEPFHQITHQFFFEDYTKQSAFPRVRNEEDGRTTLTVKVKLKDEKTNSFFKRTELEADISNAEDVIAMMPHFGFPKKITWEKRRHAFVQNEQIEGVPVFCVDETPMGWFLEIEGDEQTIEKAVEKLGLAQARRVSKAYLGLWEEYKKEHNIKAEDMLFS